jgi:hypothetical protein
MRSGPKWTPADYKGHLWDVRITECSQEIFTTL